MTEKEIRDNIGKTEFEKNGRKIVILEYDNKIVKGSYELAKWKDGVHKETKQPLHTYRKNFIESLTKALIDKIIPSIRRSKIEGEEEDFGI